jgi:hypothetical protein
MTILFQHLLRQAPSVLGLSIGPHQAAVELRVLHTKTLHGIGDVSLPMYFTNPEKTARKETSVLSSNVLLSLLVSCWRCYCNIMFERFGVWGAIE